MTERTFRRVDGLRGRLRPPGDKSISHRGLLVSALASGRTSMTGLSGGRDVRATASAMAACGVSVRISGDVMEVQGGSDLLHEPRVVLDLGNSGTGMRLLLGWAASMPWLTVLEGDASLSSRPMSRVVEPLRGMGAQVDGRGGGAYAPLVVRGGNLRGIEYELPVPSAQVKGCLLLAGLGAEGRTTVKESVATRRHTEEILELAGAEVSSGPGWAAVRASRPQGFSLRVPADPSQAAFWCVAASVVPGSELVLEDVYVGAERAGFIDVLRRMGADLELENHDSARLVADLHVRSADLNSTDIVASEVPALIDEIPALAVAATYASGTTDIAGAGELRVKESDRISVLVETIRSIGGSIEASADGLRIGGDGAAVSGGRVSSHDDHRIAMAMAIAGLAAKGPVTVEGWEYVSTSYPEFEEDLKRCAS